MKNQFAKRTMRHLLPAVAAIGLLAGVPGQASIIATIQSVTAAAGDTGDKFEVSLKNTGAAVTINSFSFGLDVAGTAITLTSAVMETSPDSYIFAGNSLFGDPLSTTSGAQEIIASDTWGGAGSGFTLGTNATVALGEVLFNVSPTATGVYTVSFEQVTTSLSDPLGGAIPINTENAGAITIIGTSPVPEPSTWALTIAATACFFLVTGARRRGAPGIRG
jgi:hypothetical protein